MIPICSKLKFQTFLMLSAIAVLLTLFLSGCGGDGENSRQMKKKVPLVKIESVRRGNIDRTVDLTGEVVSVEAIQIGSTVEGPISFCPWREGDWVEAGQKLIEIDREMYRAEVRAAEAALMVAKAKLEDMRAGTRPEEIEKARQDVRELEESATFAKTDLDRIAQLVKSGALPKEELEKAKVKQVAEQAKLSAAQRQMEMLEAGFTRTAIAVQEAVVKEGEAKVELTRSKLDECVITAPFSGTITKVYVRKGDMASVKSPLLDMADLSSLIVRSAVPETYASEIRRDMNAQIRLDALPGKFLSAKIKRVFPELDPRMRTRIVEMVVQEKVELVPGMFGRIRLILESIPDAVTVDIQAVMVTPDGTEVVFVAKEDKAFRRKVQTGIEASGRVQILSGLTPGEKVIVAGQEKLKDGAEIRFPGVPTSSPSKEKAGDKSSSPKEGGRR